MKNSFGKLGSIGAILTAALCPVCFPKLALLGALLGLDALAKYEAVFFYASQAFVLAMLVANIIGYRRYQKLSLLLLVVVSVLLFFGSLYIYHSESVSYIAFAGLIVASLWLVIESRRCAVCESVSVEKV